MANTINLGLLPSLTVVEQVDLDIIIAAMAETAEIENVSPSDPAYRVLLACAYREMLIRQYANDQAKGIMLAFATGSQLDHIGVTYYRNVNGQPVTRLENESDSDYKDRLQNSLEGLSVAGPKSSYEFHAKSAHGDVKDVLVHSPAPVEVDVYILSRNVTGIPNQGVLQAVSDYLESRRPFTDLVRVSPAKIKNYSVTVALTIKNGPDPQLVKKASEDGLRAYVELKNRLGARVVESGIYGALMVEGVEEAHLTNWTDIVAALDTAPLCNKISVTIGSIV